MTQTKLFSTGLLLLVAILAGFTASSANAQDASAPLKTPTAADYERQAAQFRGVWVSTVSNIDFPSKRGLTADELKAEADAQLDRAVEMKFTAVFLQVRPMGDAFYPSKLYPWSGFISGKQGQAPDQNLDVLQYWVEGAHKRGLQIHAWINPYRVTIGGKLEDLAENNPARLHPDWIFKHGERYFLNPGIPEAREHVVKGLVEIVTNYDVDGVHIDDYFYPERNITEDLETYEKYGKADFDNIEDWRRDNVNKFVADVNREVHKVRPNVVWSVSPAGIWANKGSHPDGSETRGNQCYFNLYADVRKWIKEETIDAVIPQIYWHIGLEIANFSILTDWWSDVCEGTDVKFYVGVAAYRLDPNSKTEAWRDLQEVNRQLVYMAASPRVDGQVFFTAKNFKEGQPARNTMLEYAKEHNWKGVNDGNPNSVK